MLSFRRSFTVSPEALASGHPYSFDSSSRSCAVSFFEFRGTGPPSSDVGYPGDVYVDLTPEQHTLYWRDRLGNGPGRWNRWTALLLDRIPLYKYLVSHPWAKDPQESDLYLWADSNGITWASKEEICASRVAMIQRGIATVMPGTIPDVEALVAEILEKMIEKEDDKVSPRIRATDRSDEKNTSNHRLSAGSSRRSISSPNPYSLSKAFPPPRSPSPVESYPSPSLRRDKGLDPPHFGPTLPPIRSPPPTSTMSYTSSQHTRPPRLASPPLPSCSDLRRSITTPPNYHLPPPPPLDYPAYNGAISANSGSQERSTNSSAQHAPAEQEHPESFAWKEMQRAQYAEAHFKRELRAKNRELSKFKKKEKDVISMSFLYQKKEAQLMSALEAAEKRSHAELEEQRAALRGAQRQIENAEEQTRNVVRELRRTEDALADARRDIKQLKSYADRMEHENRGLKEELDRLSFPRHQRPGRPLSQK